MSEESLAYEELIAQPYGDCTFSAGFVSGHEVDTLYVRLRRSDDDETTILLRPDEAAALAWCLTGALWSERMRLDTLPVSTEPAPAEGVRSESLMERLRGVCVCGDIRASHDDDGCELCDHCLEFEPPSPTPERGPSEQG